MGVCAQQPIGSSSMFVTSEGRKGEAPPDFTSEGATPHTPWEGWRRPFPRERAAQRWQGMVAIFNPAASSSVQWLPLSSLPPTPMGSEVAGSVWVGLGGVPSIPLLLIILLGPQVHARDWI